MLLDLSLSNLYLENLGATVESLLNLSNLVIFNRDALTFENFFYILNVLNIWPSQAQYLSTIDTVLFIVYSNDNYFDTVTQVYQTLPYLYALDYLHSFYIRQIIYKTFLDLYAESALSSVKAVVVSLQLDIFFANFMNK